MHSYRPLLADSCLVLAALLLLLVLHTRSSEAGLMHMCHFNQRRPHPNGLCGRRLPMVLAGLCHQFTLLMTEASNGKDVRKRDVETQLVTESKEKTQMDKDFVEPHVEDDTDLADGQSVESIVLDKKSALAYLSKRQARGDILCECCYNHCTVLELLQYCELPGM